ncbi:MAG: LCP family protein [Eubacteriales bacterium]|nr:LCP family protein [Eubacteriales bacterium]
MNPEKNRKKILWIVVGILLALVLAGAVAAGIYWNYMVSLLGNASEHTVPTLSQEELDAILGTEETVPSTTVPEDTWPQVVSDQNITNIMLVGQNYREDEQNKLSDTMLLCSINRETHTLTMVSFLRDLYVPLPAYAGHSGGRNRINVCYALGSTWKRSSEGGMEMLAKCIEQNFGVHVDHTIEVSFDTFAAIINAMDGVDVVLTQEEAEYLTDHVGYVGSFQEGENALMGYDALAYARIRKIDGDRQRVIRQRTVVASLIDKCRNMGLLELHDLATQILPLIITDMTSDEITDYLWELIPMVRDIKLESLTIPVDNETLPNSVWSKTIDLYGYPSSVLECNLTLNAQYLQNALGMEPAEK